MLYDFTFVDDKIATAYYGGMVGETEWNFCYSEKDGTLIESMELREMSKRPDGTDTNCTVLYVEITKTDERGNWIERKFSSAFDNWTEKRVIYYEEKASNETTESAEMKEHEDNNIDFTSEDLLFFELHGHVKSVEQKYMETTRTFNFNDKGVLTSIDNIPLGGEIPYEEWDFPRITKGKDGRIYEIGTIDGGQEVIWREDKPYKFESAGEGGCYCTETRQYDDKGRLKTINGESGSDYDDDVNIYTFNYIYIEEDDHGNWTKRTAKSSDGSSKQELRVITYYK